MYPRKRGNFCKLSLAEVENMKMNADISACKGRYHADEYRRKEGRI